MSVERSKTSWPRGDSVSIPLYLSQGVKTNAVSGDKVREQKEETEREVENQRRAGSAYASPEPGDLESNRELSGLPWGGLSMKHIVETGKSKEQNSQRSSREDSVYAAASGTGGSSR